MEASFLSFLEITSKVNNERSAPVPHGAVIDPGYYGVTISAKVLDDVISIIKH